MAGASLQGSGMGIERKNCFPADQFPSIKSLAAAIRALPRVRANVKPQTVEIDAWPLSGRYSVTFALRQKSNLETAFWYWGVEGSERLADTQERVEGND